MRMGKRKNQFMITGLAVMIAVAGYLNFSGKEISLLDGGDGVKSVSSDAVNEDTVALDTDLEDRDMLVSSEDFSQITETTAQDASTQQEASANQEMSSDVAVSNNTGDDSLVSASVNDEVDSVAVASSNVINNEILSAKMSKEQSRSKNKEMLNSIIESEQVSKSERKEATKQLLKISDYMEKESAAEEVLRAKGYPDCMVSMSDNSVDVMVHLNEISDVDRAKIEDVVQRKTGVSINNIVISSMK